MRHRVRVIASTMAAASWARSAKSRRPTVRAWEMSRPIARTWEERVKPRRIPSTERSAGMRPGSTTVAATTPTHAPSGAPGRRKAPTTIEMTPKMGASERRRLSSIFQVPSPLMRARRLPKIQGSNCQSPRVQRWVRERCTA